MGKAHKYPPRLVLKGLQRGVLLLRSYCVDIFSPPGFNIEACIIAFNLLN
jgi:hypothetical protein